ncbi:MAG: RrF2 family transcriptional regulator, partial [Chloroflexota bacterium]
MRLELTRRGAYAIRALTALARAGEGSERTAAAIARSMGIPRGFLPQVLADLGRAGLVTARLGRGGGYRLARAPGTITLLDAIAAVEGDVRRRECVLRGAACGTAAAPCEVHAV